MPARLQALLVESGSSQRTSSYLRRCSEPSRFCMPSTPFSTRPMFVRLCKPCCFEILREISQLMFGQVKIVWQFALYRTQRSLFLGSISRSNGVWRMFDFQLICDLRGWHVSWIRPILLNFASCLLYIGMFCRSCHIERPRKQLRSLLWTVQVVPPEVGLQSVPWRTDVPFVKPPICWHRGKNGFLLVGIRVQIRSWRYSASYRSGTRLLGMVWLRGRCFWKACRSPEQWHLLETKTTGSGVVELCAWNRSMFRTVKSRVARPWILAKKVSFT